MKEGWEIKKLGDVCEVMNGGTPKTGVPENWDGSHLWITPAEMGKRLSPYVSNTERKLTDFGLRDSSARMLPPKSVILSSRAPIGYLVINTEPMATNQGCKGLIPRSQIHYKYLYYYLLSIVDLLNSLGTGATFKELSGGKLKEVTIPLSALSEQFRLVAILDEAFDGIATAKANADKNLKNARQLFESHLNSVFSQRGEGWVEKRLGDIADVQSGGTPSISQKTYWGGNIPWYSSGELNTIFTYKSERQITEQGLNNSNAKLFKKGSLLIGMYDTAALKMSILDRDGAFNQAIAGVRLNKQVQMEFLLYAINALKPKLLLERRGVRQKNLSLGKIKDIILPVPNLAVQQSIVNHINTLATKTKRLESIYQKKIEALDALKKSILQKAFAGGL